MELSQTEKTKLVSYLLGQLSEPEQQTLEESVFADQVKFYQLCELEDQLLARHARGELRGAELTQFEQQYLVHPVRRARVEFAQTLAAEFDHAEVTAPPWWQSVLASLRQPLPAWGLTATALLLIGVTTWWMLKRPKISELIAHNGAASPSPTIAGTPSPTVSFTLTPPPRVTPLPLPVAVPATITLTAFTLRGEPPSLPETLQIALEQTVAQIHIKLPDQDYPVYQARLQTSAGQIVKSWTAKPGKTNTGQLLTLSLPTRALSAGDYLLILEARTATGAIEPIAKLPFNVAKP